MEEGDYRRANLAFEWIASQADDIEVQSKARLGRARSLKKMEDFDRALEVIKTINVMGSPPELRPAIVYEELLIRSLSGDFQGVLSKASFTRPIMQEGEYQAPVLLLQSISSYELRDFENGKKFAEHYLDLIDGRMGTHHRIRFDSLTRSASPEFKKIRKAELLSSFVPGLGQCYAGFPGEGALSFGLHALSLGGAIWAALGGYYMTAWMGAAILVQRLYIGGRNRSIELATKKNRLEAEQYLQPIFQFLLTIDSST